MTKTRLHIGYGFYGLNSPVLTKHSIQSMPQKKKDPGLPIWRSGVKKPQLVLTSRKTRRISASVQPLREWCFINCWSFLEEKKLRMWRAIEKSIEVFYEVSHTDSSPLSYRPKKGVCINWIDFSVPYSQTPFLIVVNECLQEKNISFGNGFGPAGLYNYQIDQFTLFHWWRGWSDDPDDKNLLKPSLKIHWPAPWEYDPE